MTNNKGKDTFHYRLCPGTFGHALRERKNFGPTKKLICKLLGITA